MFTFQEIMVQEDYDEKVELVVVNVKNEEGGGKESESSVLLL